MFCGEEGEEIFFESLNPIMADAGRGLRGPYDPPQAAAGTPRAGGQWLLPGGFWSPPWRRAHSLSESFEESFAIFLESLWCQSTSDPGFPPHSRLHFSPHNALWVMGRGGSVWFSWGFGVGLFFSCFDLFFFLFYGHLLLKYLNLCFPVLL